tara:strand:- start:992 stop:1327 length:336 start_codon:yes stop_codon:yes gene_type:complete
MFYSKLGQFFVDKKWDAEASIRWSKVTCRGMKSYILINGIALWGSIVFLGITGGSLFLKEKNISGKPTAPDLDIILVNLTLCVLGGFLYGYLTWTLNCLSDKHYKEKQFKL